MAHTHLIKEHTWSLETYGLSDIGLRRSNNEDVWGYKKDALFCILADGMGGHVAGEVAAQLAVDTLCKKAAPASHFATPQELALFLHEAILDTNQDIYRKALEDTSLRGMGTTLCCMQPYRDLLIYAHVGDSRIYRFRDGTLEQLTKDHTLKRSVNNIERSFLTKALGTSSYVRPSLASTPLHPNDLYFMCSDGLTDCVKNQEIINILSKEKDLIISSKQLISLAKSKGSGDNITILMTKIATK